MGKGGGGLLVWVLGRRAANGFVWIKALCKKQRRLDTRVDQADRRVGIEEKQWNLQPKLAM